MKARISDNVRFFKEAFLEKYGLQEHAGEPDETVVMFGMYNGLEDDKNFYLNHPGKLIVIWVGTDARTIDKEFVRKRSARHIATSKFISTSLGDLEHEIIPVTPAKAEMKVRPNNGNCIYHYGDRPIYRPEWIPEIERRTGLEVIHAKHDTFSKSELDSVYEKCFVGLRLTDHDGVSCTVLEMGLMGRRSIFNGGYATNIPWKSLDHVCELIIREYRNRPDPQQVAQELYDYINIGNSWLE